MVTVEEVKGRAAFKRFFEFPFGQFRSEPRWSPPVLAHQRARLDPHRNPFFDHGDGEYFLARRGGVVAGRITAHVATSGTTEGWFGFFDAVDDAAVVHALLDAASAWLADHGCTTMTGPASFTISDDPGVLVDGFDAAGTTGRPWHPPWYAAHLGAAGLARIDDHPTWRHPLVDLPRSDVAHGDVLRSATPEPVAGKFGDPRIVLADIAAVPDLSPARGAPMALARRARRREWEGCTVVRVNGDASVLVPRLEAVAAACGYRWMVAPWHAEPAPPPETVHARFTTTL